MVLLITGIVTFDAPAPGEPSRITALETLGKHVPYTQQPSLSQLPAVIAGLVYKDLVEPIAADTSDAVESVSHRVAHAISPPDPHAGSGVTYAGVDPAQYNSLKAEVELLKQQLASVLPRTSTDPLADLKAQVATLREQTTPAQASAAEAAVDAAPDALSRVSDPAQAELLELRQLVQQLQIQAAAGQHPTATSEPIPDPPEAA